MKHKKKFLTCNTVYFSDHTEYKYTTDLNDAWNVLRRKSVGCNTQNVAYCVLISL